METIGIALSEEVDDEYIADQLPVTVECTNNDDKKFIMGNQLTDEFAVLERFPDVFSEVPGRTNLIEHDIKLRDETPCIRQPRFRIPETLKPEIEAEIQNILKSGFNHESDTEFVSNLVAVRRKSGFIRLCTDLRLVNQKPFHVVIGVLISKTLSTKL